MGDALSATAVVTPADSERTVARAKLILEAMGQLGYAGYVVGERDLSLGLEPLRQLATASKVPLLSANLTDEGGQPLFTGHAVVQAGSFRVCAVAITGKIDAVRGVLQTDPVAAAQTHLDALGQSHCDVKLLLAHMPLSELEPVLKTVPGFDLALSAHQGYQMGAKTLGTTPVLFPGERGRQVLRVKLESSGGQAPFVDQANLERLHEDVAGLDRQIEETKKRKKAATKDQFPAFDRTLDTFDKRRQDLTKRIDEQGKVNASRVFKGELVNLGTDVADDPSTLAAVDQYLAVFPEPHPVPPVPPHPPASAPPPN